MINNVLTDLLDLIKAAWKGLIPFQIVDAYEEGIVLRLGKFQRVLKPGLRWKIPLVDRFVLKMVVIRTLNLPTQSLVTWDNKNIVIGAVLKYKISDVKAYILDVYDPESAIVDTTLGELTNYVMIYDFDQLKRRIKDLGSEVSKSIQEKLNVYGIELIDNKLTITDMQPIKSLRIFLDNNYKDFDPKDE